MIGLLTKQQQYSLVKRHNTPADTTQAIFWSFHVASILFRVRIVWRVCTANGLLVDPVQ
jgi:hypothetical protein